MDLLVSFVSAVGMTVLLIILALITGLTWILVRVAKKIIDILK